MKKTITWTLGNGKPAKCTVELVTEKTNYCDGHNVVTKCCELEIVAKAMGQTGYGEPEKTDHPVAVAKIDNIGLKQQQYDEIIAAIAECKATPEWQAKMERIAKAAKADAEYQAHRDEMRKVMGY